MAAGITTSSPSLAAIGRCAAKAIALSASLAPRWRQLPIFLCRHGQPNWTYSHDFVDPMRATRGRTAIHGRTRLPTLLRRSRLLPWLRGE